MRHSTRTSPVAIALLLAVFTTAGCSSTPEGGSTADDASSPAPASESSSVETGASRAASPDSGGSTTETATITIADFEYVGPASIAPGTQITVVNEDSQAHTLTAEDAGGFDAVVPPGESVTFTAPAAGSYPYICIYHSNMSGTLEVG